MIVEVMMMVTIMGMEMMMVEIVVMSIMIMVEKIGI